jgi:hypothetical protein
MEMMALLHRNEVIQCGYVGAVVDGFGIAIALSLEHAWTWSVDGRRGMECGVKWRASPAKSMPRVASIVHYSDIVLQVTH